MLIVSWALVTRKWRMGIISIDVRACVVCCVWYIFLVTEREGKAAGGAAGSVHGEDLLDACNFVITYHSVEGDADAWGVYFAER